MDTRIRKKRKVVTDKYTLDVRNVSTSNNATWHRMIWEDDPFDYCPRNSLFDITRSYYNSADWVIRQTERECINQGHYSDYTRKKKI